MFLINIFTYFFQAMKTTGIEKTAFSLLLLIEKYLVI